MQSNKQVAKLWITNSTESKAEVYNHCIPYSWRYLASEPSAEIFVGSNIS